MRIRKIGVLTGGGDCPGLNAVIRAVVKTAHHRHRWKVYGIRDSFEGLLRPDKTKLLTQDSIRGIIVKGGTILGTSNRYTPFTRELSSHKQKNGGPQNYSRRILNKIRELGLDALVIIGGDGTLGIADKFHDMGVPLVAVPKTIDNDLSATEVTFGFDTAIQTATDAIDKLHSTAESHHRVIVVEVMGRDSGWIAIVAGIAGGADVILIPEIPFKIGPICDTILRRSKSGRAFSLVVVAEGAKAVTGKQVYVEKDGPSGYGRLGGIGNLVGTMIGDSIDMEVRVTVLGHLQRGGSPTPYDRLLATRFGVAAVETLAKHEFGSMVRLKCGEISTAPIKDAIDQRKYVDPAGELVHTARSIGISFGN